MPTGLEEVARRVPPPRKHPNPSNRQVPSAPCPIAGQRLVLRSLAISQKYIESLPEPSLTGTSQPAAENLVPYSKTQPSIFKTAQLTPIKDLKLLVKDYPPIAKHALTILINISTDPEILKSLAEDDALLESIFVRVTNPKEPNADLLSMLLSNLAKSDSLSRLLPLTRSAIPSLSSLTTTTTSSPTRKTENAINQLLALFNAGVHGKYNPAATFEHLAYLFADLAKFPKIATHLAQPQGEEAPLLAILTPHTHPPTLPLPLRLGAVSTIRNALLALPDPHTHIPALLPHILPSLLLPLIGPDPSFAEQETDLLPPELQYLGPEQQRETDARVLREIIEALFLILARCGEGAGEGGEGGEEGAKGAEVREMVKGMGAYAVLREFHLAVDEDEGVRAGVERCVQLLMGGEEAEGMVEREKGRVTEVVDGEGLVGKEGRGVDGGGTMVRGEMYKGEESDSEDDKMVEIF
ncbi:MAG: hypothetical protein LQ350_002813 [Teloschistes chrysophthalmus]|nr:MAG: hypothetical protein LQ350_002813 [Niorma chrysophthalma]